MLHDYLIDNPEYEIAAFTVEREYICTSSFLDLPLVAFEDIDREYPPDSCSLLLGVGYSQMNSVKERLYNLYKSKKYSFATYSHPSAVIPKDISLGEGNVFFEGTIVQRGCHIGNGNVFFAKTLIAHDCKIGDFNSFSDASVAGNVVIKNRCFIGMGSVIAENKLIEDRVFIGANSYVNTNMEEGWMSLGTKSKIIKSDISDRIIDWDS